MLTLSSIAKTYATPAGPLRVLDGVDLTIATGEAAVITGPSGSGKSTLLYIAGGLEPPTSGAVDLRRHQSRMGCHRTRSRSSAITRWGLCSRITACFRS